jgi:hypothetical protein
MPLRTLIGAGLVLAALILLLATASAAPVCAPRAAIVAKLAASYGEVTVGRGVTSNGALMEMFVGPKATWTIVVTRPGGLSCIAGVGEAWQGETGAPMLSPKVVPGAERGS